ncbi:MAG: VTT domain-containing protein, partial [Acidobacteriota bacterium]
MLKKLLILLVAAVFVVVFFQQGWNELLTFDNLKAQQNELQAKVDANKPLAAGIFFGAYVIMAALSLPGAAIMTLAGGAFFGLGLGLVLVSFSSSLGATLAMLFSRYLFRSSVQERFGQKLKALDEGIEREGGFYLFTLRLIPIF